MTIQTGIEDKYKPLIIVYLQKVATTAGTSTVGDGNQFTTYVVSLNDIINLDLTSKAKKTGCIFLNNEEGNIQEIEVYDVEDNNEAKIVGQSEKVTSLMKEVKERVDWANKNLPIVEAHDYISQELIIPSLHTSLLWLKPKDETQGLPDYFIPMIEFPGQLEKNKAYSSLDVLKVLRPIAETVLKKREGISVSADI
ncbi:MAG: hypothetical protein AB4062_15025 [Crocosphaera sp.]